MFHALQTILFLREHNNEVLRNKRIQLGDARWMDVSQLVEQEAGDVEQRLRHVRGERLVLGGEGGGGVSVRYRKREIQYKRFVGSCMETVRFQQSTTVLTK